MDNSPDGVTPDLIASLSYDDTIAYEEQVPTNEPERSSLANRIGSAKFYLLSESSTSRVGKRKHGEQDEENSAADDDDDEMDDDLTYRGNALLLHGPPISHMPTARIFAYATHFDTHPMGLEWVDDNTCVFVFETKSAARTGYRYLQKSATEDPDIDGLITAKPIPIALWPPEERINSSLGKGQGLKGTIRMRWAKTDDVKKKGARKDSEFYRRHGDTAGKGLNERDEAPPKRRRRDDAEDKALRKAQLDNDLDEFLNEDASISEPMEPSPPPSKMRSDYISTDGRTLLERTSAIRAHPDTLASRITAPLPRRARETHSNEPLEPDALGRWQHANVTPLNDKESRSKGRSSRGTRNGRVERPIRKTQQELDDELDAFLNEKD